MNCSCVNPSSRVSSEMLLTIRASLRSSRIGPLDAARTQTADSTPDAPSGCGLHYLAPPDRVHSNFSTRSLNLKITSIQAIPLAIPMKPMDPPSTWRAGTRKQILVRVLTDDGPVGTGEACAYGAPLAVCAVIEESLAPLLVGQDPSRIEALVDLMHRGTMIYGRRGLGMFAISGVEIALWDLLGRALDAPVWALLGGAVRPRLPAYASLLRYDSPSDVGRAGQGFVEQGFRMLKLHQTDVNSVRAARETVGPDVELMLDTNCPWTPDDAIRMARALHPYRLFWLEEPVWPPEDYAGLARVAAAT